MGGDEVTEELLRCRADPRQTHRGGPEPLLLAAQGGHLKVAVMLLHRRADPIAADERSASFPLLLAAQNGHLFIVDALLRQEADATQYNLKTGTSPLLQACLAGHAGVVEALLQARALPNQFHLKKPMLTPLVLARRSKHSDVEATLLKH